MYRLITESLLGLHREGRTLRFKPRPPANWESFRIHYRYCETTYHITILNRGPGASIQSLSLDGIAQPDMCISLVDDQCNHEVELELT